MKTLYFISFLILLNNILFGQIKIKCDDFDENIYGKYIIIQERISFGNNIYGVIDTLGNKILDLKYKSSGLNDVSIFENIFFGVDANTSKTTLINLDNKMIIKEAKYFEYKGFYNNYALIKGKIDKKRFSTYFLIDKNGKLISVLPDNIKKKGLGLDNHGYLSDGLIKISFTKKGTTNFNGYGFINNKSDIIIKPRFSGANNFHEGIAIVNLYNNGINKWGGINKKGETIIDFKFSNEPSSFSDGMSRIETKNNLYGFMNYKGIIIINPKYEYATGFYKGKALVKEPNKNWKLIDKNEKTIQEFKKVNKFVNYSNDYSSQKVDLIKKIIDENRVIVTFVDDYFSTYVINSKDKIAFKNIYNRIEQFNNGMAYAELYDKEKSNTIVGFINKLGKFIIIAQKSQF